MAFKTHITSSIPIVRILLNRNKPATQLMALQIPIYYFSSNDSRVEIDLIVQYGTAITPIEIKAEENVRAKSLRTFIEKHPNLKGLRLSMKPYQDQEWMVNKPLYGVGAWL